MSDRFKVGTWCLRGGNHINTTGECSSHGPAIELVFDEWWSEREKAEALDAFEAEFGDNE